MYLTENTPEAEELRGKIDNLLRSNYAPNYALAVSLIAGGGFDFRFFPRIWLGYFLCNDESVRQTGEAILQASLPEALMQVLQPHIDERKMYEWTGGTDVFGKFTFYEALISTQIFDLETLTKLWYEDAFFADYPELTVFLLSKGIVLDKILFEKRFFLPASLPDRQDMLLRKPPLYQYLVQCGLYNTDEMLARWEDLPDNRYEHRHGLTEFFVMCKETINKRFFLHPRLSVERLRELELDFLWQDDSFDKKAFLQRFVQKGVLNLHKLRISTLPAEALALPNVHTLNIIGTKIKTLPLESIKHFQDIQASQKVRRKINGLVLSLGAWDFPFAQKLAYQKSQEFWETKQYVRAFELLEIAEKQAISPAFSETEKGHFWERYFGSAVFAGKLEKAMYILRKALNALPAPLWIMGWKSWHRFVTELCCADKEQAFLEKLEEKHSEIAPQLQAYLHYHYNWRRMCERLALAGRFEDCFRVFEKARTYCENLYPSSWHWLAIFRDLQARKKYAEIVQLFAYFEHSVFYAQSDYKSLIRYVWIWAEAHIAVGKLEKAELFCVSQIERYYQTQPLAKTNERYTYYTATHFYKKICPYLTAIYTAQGKLTCAEFYRQEEERLEAEIKSVLQTD